MDERLFRDCIYRYLVANTSLVFKSVRLTCGGGCIIKEKQKAALLILDQAQYSSQRVS